MKYLSILFIVLSMACSNNKNITKTETTTPATTNSIALSRTGCFGTCPMYDLKIYANGKVEYNGRAYVDYIGAHEAQADQKELKALFNKIESYNWADYPEKYPIDNVDFPQFKLTYSSNESTTEVKGNSRAAEELILLTKELDDLVKSLELTKVAE